MPITAEAAARPAPSLMETARLEAAMTAAEPSITALGAQRDDLTARAEGLRSAAAALSAPVLAPADAARLRALGTEGIAAE